MKNPTPLVKVGEVRASIIKGGGAKRRRVLFHHSPGDVEYLDLNPLCPSPTPPNQNIFPVLLDIITLYIIKQGGYHVPLPDREF